MRRLRSYRPSHTTVVAYLSLFLVLTGGTAFALSGSNTVFSDDITDGEVKNPDIAQNSIGGGKVVNGSLGGLDVNESSLGKVPDADRVDGLDSTVFLRGVSFRHTSTPEDRGDAPDCTRLDHPAINDNPDADVVVTHRSGQGPAKPVRVRHSATFDGWVICTEDGSDMAGTHTWSVIGAL